jgi:hypothetical protein
LRSSSGDRISATRHCRGLTIFEIALR